MRKIGIKVIPQVEFINLNFNIIGSNMTTLERMEKVIFSNAGVLYLKGKPGVGKSAVAQQIAEKNKLKFIDLRLSQIDASEVAGIPYKKTIEVGTGANKKTHDVMAYSLPEWAIIANQQPTLVIFDELNRAELPTTNAALQIFNERRIGWDFKFNDNVYFIAAGNLGEEDSTQVEVFDSALNGRLIHMRFQPTTAEWLDYAKKIGVNKAIIDFIRARDGYLYRASTNQEEAYASPRSWVNFSKMLGDADIEEIKLLNQELGSSYIGGAAMSFTKFLEEMTVINVNQIIEDYSKVKGIVASANRSKISELLNDLKSKEFKKFNILQTRNVINFLKDIDKDEVVGYVNHLLETDFENDEPSKNLATLMKEMPELKSIIKSVL